MPLLLLLFALLVPRVTIVLIWFFSNWFQGVFSSALWPLLGFIFLPLTLLWYAAVQHWFGGGLGMLITPLCVLAFSAKGKDPSFAIGILLPLLCAGDAFSMYYYWGRWNRDNLKYLLPGVVGGVVIGSHLIGRFSNRQIN